MTAPGSSGWQRPSSDRGAPLPPPTLPAPPVAGAAPSRPPRFAPPPDRPKVTAAVCVAISGAIAMVIGTALTWFEITAVDGSPLSPMPGVETTVNGFTTTGGTTNDGPYFVALAAIAAIFAIVVAVRGRTVWALVIVLIAGLCGFGFAVVDFADVLTNDLSSLLSTEPGPGLPLIAAGGVIVTFGAIVGLRRP